MTMYKIREAYQGYVRGMRTVLVKAGSEEEAKRNSDLGKIIEDDIDRDDTSSEIQSIEEYKGY